MSTTIDQINSNQLFYFLQPSSLAMTAFQGCLREALSYIESQRELDGSYILKGSVMYENPAFVIPAAYKKAARDFGQALSWRMISYLREGDSDIRDCCATYTDHAEWRAAMNAGWCAGIVGDRCAKNAWWHRISLVMCDIADGYGKVLGDIRHNANMLALTNPDD